MSRHRSLNSFSLQVGKLADLVLWNPAFFGAKPEIIIKGGDIAWANMGDANASIPTPEPVTIIFMLLSRLLLFTSISCWSCPLQFHGVNYTFSIRVI